MDETCSQCKHYDGGDEIGFCQRYPPVVIDAHLHWKMNNSREAGDIQSIIERWQFPSVQSNCSCGEFMALDSPEPGGSTTDNDIVDADTTVNV